MTDKLDEYKTRQQQWRDISLTQLSNTNNILLTLTAGLLVLILEKTTTPKIYFNISNPIALKPTLFILTLSLLGISLCYGIGVLFTRLYDFRISRHIALTRQRTYHKHKEKGLLPDTDLGDLNFCHRINALKNIIFCKLKFITKTEIEKAHIKFNHLGGTHICLKHLS